jgi:hypothetical protein
MATAPETTAPEETTTAPTTEPTEPPVEKIATATILNTGDLLYHERVINSGYDKETKTYNYDTIFNYIAPYVQKADYAVANLEGTLAGNTNGYKYSGYPCFNTPDESVDAAIKAGFDLMLTANNHTYDTKTTGFHRTQQVLQEKNVDYIGTRTDESQKTYIVKDINGIKVGMVCYTYQSGVNSNGTKKLNGISMSKENATIGNKDFHCSYSLSTGELQYVFRRENGELSEVPDAQDYTFMSQTFENGDRYVGEFYKGKRHGLGIYYYATGGLWYGTFQNDIRDGFGAWFKTDNDMVIGIWEGDDERRRAYIPVK